ncbi:MAG: alpha/beta hydrolase [Pseudomonadota bacterium]
MSGERAAMRGVRATGRRAVRPHAGVGSRVLNTLLGSALVCVFSSATLALLPTGFIAPVAAQDRTSPTRDLSRILPRATFKPWATARLAPGSRSIVIALPQRDRPVQELRIKAEDGGFILTRIVVQGTQGRQRVDRYGRFRRQQFTTIKLRRSIGKPRSLRLTYRLTQRVRGPLRITILGKLTPRQRRRITTSRRPQEQPGVRNLPVIRPPSSPPRAQPSRPRAVRGLSPRRRPPASAAPRSAQPATRGIRPAARPSIRPAAPPKRRTRSVRSAIAAPPATASGTGEGGGAPAAKPDWHVMPVLFGTDRKQLTFKKRIRYGATRARRLELGRALVTVPKLHKVPQVERPWAITLPFFGSVNLEREDPKRHFTLQEVRTLSREDFIAFAKQRFTASKRFKRQAIVFIHGYNTAFDNALYRTAQIAYDLKFDGQAFMYSWPSGGGYTSYTYDRESARQSEPFLRDFLQTVVKATGADAVNIIAHSMGNLPLLQVLRDLRRDNPDGVNINQVILAAPDVDRDVFENLAREIQGISRGITLYVSANDRAMDVSRQVNGGIYRAGDVGPNGPVIVSGIDTIDVSATTTTWLSINHSTFAEKTALLKDIDALLRTGERPPERRSPVLQRVITPRGAFWRYQGAP